MKPNIARAMLASLVLGLASCESDLPPDPSAQNPLERGISGHGSLSTPDKAGDPLIRDNPNAGN